jgi:hypothetical protein
LLSAGYAQLNQGRNTNDKYAVARLSGGGIDTSRTSLVSVSANVLRHVAASAIGARTSSEEDTNSLIYIDGALSLGTFFSDHGYAVVSSVGKNYAATNGWIADAMIWSRVLAASEISALADPSNVMLSGLILPPRRRLFAAATAATTSNPRRRLLLCTGA